MTDLEILLPALRTLRLGYPGDNEASTESFLLDWHGLRYLGKKWNKAIMLMAFYWYPNVDRNTSPLILYTRGIKGWVNYFHPLAGWDTQVEKYAPADQQSALQYYQQGTHAVAWCRDRGWFIGEQMFQFFSRDYIALRLDFSREVGHGVLLRRPDAGEHSHYWQTQTVYLLNGTDSSGISLKQLPTCSYYYWSHRSPFDRSWDAEFPKRSMSCTATFHPDGLVSIIGDDEFYFKVEFYVPSTTPWPAVAQRISVNGRFHENNDDLSTGSCNNEPTCPCGKTADPDTHKSTSILYSIIYHPEDHKVRIDSINRHDMWFELKLTESPNRMEQMRSSAVQSVLERQRQKRMNAGHPPKEKKIKTK